MKTIPLIFTILIIAHLSFELVAQERRTIVSPKNGESNSNKASLDHYRKFSYTLKDISLLSGNKVKISGKDNAYAILDELNVVLFFTSNPNPNAMENRMGDFAGRYEITFKINPVIYVNNKPVPFTEAVDYEKSIEVKLYGLHRLVAKTNGSVNRESKIVDAAAFLYGSMIVDINSLTQREKGYNKGMIPRYTAIFGTNDPREAFRLYKSGWGIERPSVPVSIELEGLVFKGDYVKQKEQALQIKTAEKKDDFWDSPTKAVAETKKSGKDDFWDSPNKAANKATTKSEKSDSGNKDFWDSPTSKGTNKGAEKNYETFFQSGKEGLKVDGNVVIDPIYNGISCSLNDGGLLEVTCYTRREYVRTDCARMVKIYNVTFFKGYMDKKGNWLSKGELASSVSYEPTICLYTN